MAPAHNLLMLVLLSSAGDWKAESMSTHGVHRMRKWESQVIESANVAPKKDEATERQARAKASQPSAGSK